MNGVDIVQLVLGVRKHGAADKSGKEREDRDKRELIIFIADSGYKLMVPSTRALPLWSLDGDLDRLSVTDLREYWFALAH